MSYLNNDQKRQIIEQRLLQWSAELYDNQLNLKTAEAVNNTELIESASANIATLETAIATLEAELSNLE